MKEKGKEKENREQYRGRAAATAEDISEWARERVRKQQQEQGRGSYQRNHLWKSPRTIGPELRAWKCPLNV